ncbi:MAG: hypothetical protein PHV11_09280, partial [Candidatus Bipolaricaulis sp.]|jgi:hypothetical protein|nr:hypothetical protein [Candidatus Bipolaricaulis sp.]
LKNIGIEMLSRAKELERAVEHLLIYYKLKFIRLENYRCFRCGQVQNSKGKGLSDFYIYSPIHFAVECKTGAGRLTKEQKSVREDILRAGDDYVIVRDTVDELVDYLKAKKIL